MRKHFKAYLNPAKDDGDEVRRFVVDQDVSTSFAHLQDKISTTFPCISNTQLFTVKWTDNDGDKITISSDEELTIALTEMTGPLYKIQIEMKETTAGEQNAQFQAAPPPLFPASPNNVPGCHEDMDMGPMDHGGKGNLTCSIAACAVMVITTLSCLLSAYKNEVMITMIMERLANVALKVIGLRKCQEKRMNPPFIHEDKLENHKKGCVISQKKARKLITWQETRLDTRYKIKYKSALVAV